MNLVLFKRNPQIQIFFSIFTFFLKEFLSMFHLPILCFKFCKEKYCAREYATTNDLNTTPTSQGKKSEILNATPEKFIDTFLCYFFIF